MSFLDLIERKRDGGRLDDDEIRSFVREVVEGLLPPEQVSAFLMAILFRGLDEAERRELTGAMRDSGETLTFAADRSRPVVDKHSTGGVGDKVSLPLAPLLASLGFRVPMISGRGLGITGGTLDKLESIPGFRTDLGRERIVELVETLGVAMAGQTARMVPADRILYALRDVTGTVPSLDLITASILSKKLAEGIEALVLDVKVGRAAFMREAAQARSLAEAMTRIASASGVGTRAFLTRMDVPLGRSAGNWLEVRESVECLRGRGPTDLRSLVILFAGSLLQQTGRVPELQDGIRLAAAELDSGRPLALWNRLIVLQGGNLEAYERRLALESTAPVVREIRSSRSGFLTDIDARILGEEVRRLGAGRLKSGDSVDPEVGVEGWPDLGAPVRTGDILARVHARNPKEGDETVPRLASAFRVTDEPVELPPLLVE